MPSRGVGAGLASLALLASLTGLACTATTGTSSGLQRELDTLQVSVDRLRQQQVETAARLQDLDDVEDATTHSDASQLQERLVAMEEQVQVLLQATQGTAERLEGMAYDLERFRYQMNDMSQTMAASHIGDITQTTPDGGIAATDVNSPGGDDPGVVIAPPLVSRQEDPAGVFQKAYADYTRGDFELAVMGFNTVLSQRPDGELADDAVYYLAEIDVAQGRPGDALNKYARVKDEYPRSDKVPAAILKRGLLLIDDNRLGEGVVQLDYLVKSFPDSDEARLAKNRLNALGVSP